jgi:hypothetical protein
MYPTRTRVPVQLAAVVTMATLAAQTPPPLIGVNFGVSLTPNSTAFQINRSPLTLSTIGPTGTQRLNSLATVNGTLYSVASIGSLAAQTRELVQVDPLTGAATTIAPLNVDIRGLSDVPGSSDLFGIADGAPDRLVRIQTGTGQVTNVGPTGFSSIQGLAHDGVNLYAWDLTDGLLVVDPATGSATDVNPALGGQSAAVQFLCFDGTQLLGGADTLFRVDPNGVLFVQGNLGTPGLRGVEVRRAIPFGLGCGPSAAPELSLPGEVRAGGTVRARTTGQSVATLGLLAVGLSTTTWNGVPLPLDLDPVFGTTDCNLLVSADLLLVGAAGTSGLLDVPLTLPNVVGFDVHIQLAVLPSGLSSLRLTRAATIRLLP